MQKIPAPTHSADHVERSREGEKVFAEACEALIRNAVAAGWREHEAALMLADAADDYCLYVVAKPNWKRFPANTNRPAGLGG